MQKRVSLLLPVLLFLIFSSIVHDVSAIYDLEGEISIEYTVLDSNNSTGYWSNYPSPEGFYYNVEVESSIYVTFQIFEDRSTPLELSIGNITLEGINESIVQDNLAFGYWSLADTFGFRANTNWDQIENDLKDTAGLNSTVDYGTESYLGNKINIVTISLKDLYQESSMIYEERSGLLIYGYSEVFGFLLEMEISSINGDMTFFSNHFSNNGETPVMFPIILILGVIFVRSHKIRV